VLVYLPAGLPACLLACMHACLYFLYKGPDNALQEFMKDFAQHSVA
jgi:hypothetical protein